MIRVMQFADVINRYDFIDNIVQRADRSRFEVGVCTRTSESNIEAPVYDQEIPRWRRFRFHCTLNRVSDQLAHDERGAGR